MPAPKSAENLRSLSAALSIETPPASICSTTCTAHVSIRQHTPALSIDTPPAGEHLLDRLQREEWLFEFVPKYLGTNSIHSRPTCL